MKRVIASTIASLHGLVPLAPLGAGGRAAVIASEGSVAGASAAAFTAFEAVTAATTGGAAVLASLLAPAIAQASPAKLAAARQQYAVGDIPSAARALQSLVGASGGLRGAQLEDARKLFGICQFLLGNKSQAEAAFASVLKGNPGAQLNKKDVIDPAIGELFEGVRARVVAKGAPAEPARVAGGGGAPASAPPAPRGFTGVHVKTNAENATVFANGIFIGTSGQDINLDPGEHKLTISASGFEEVTRSFLVKRNERLTLTVNLVKAGERERRAAAIAAANKARAAQAAKARRAAAIAEKKKQDEKDALDYTSDLPAGAKKGRAQQSLADEFFRDSSAPMQAAPPPQAYPQQNPYAAQQPQQAYAPPPPQAYGGGYQQNSLAPGYNPQPTVKKKSLFLALLPLGAGQFQNGDTGLGIAIALGQIVFVGVGVYYFMELKSYNNGRDNVCGIEVQCKPGDTAIPADVHAAYEKELTTYSYTGFGLATAVWIGGAIEAVMSMNSGPARPAAPGAPGVPPPPGYYGSTPPGSPAVDTEWRLRPVSNPLTGALGLKLDVTF